MGGSESKSTRAVLRAGARNDTVSSLERHLERELTPLVRHIGRLNNVDHFEMASFQHPPLLILLAPSHAAIKKALYQCGTRGTLKTGKIGTSYQYVVCEGGLNHLPEEGKGADHDWHIWRTFERLFTPRVSFIQRGTRTTRSVFHVRTFDEPGGNFIAVWSDEQTKPEELKREAIHAAEHGGIVHSSVLSPPRVVASTRNLAIVKYTTNVYEQPQLHESPRAAKRRRLPSATPERVPRSQKMLSRKLFGNRTSSEQ